VFARRAAKHMTQTYSVREKPGEITINPDDYAGYQEAYKEMVLEAIEKEKNSHE